MLFSSFVRLSGIFFRLIWLSHMCYPAATGVVMTQDELKATGKQLADAKAQLAVAKAAVSSGGWS